MEKKTKVCYRVTKWDYNDNISEYGVFDTEEDAIRVAENAWYCISNFEHLSQKKLSRTTIYVDKVIMEYDEDSESWEIGSEDREQVYYISMEKLEEEKDNRKE